MSQINPTSGAGSTSGATSTLSGSQGSAMLDKDAFLKLMMVQLQHQDPLNPSDPTQYLSELASFTTLEQETNIATSTAHDHLRRGRIDRQLGEGVVEHADVINRRARPRVARPKHPCQRFAGGVEVGDQGVEPEPVLVGRRCLLLVGVGADQGGVDVDHIETRVRALRPGGRSSGGPCRLDPLQRSGVDRLQGSPRRGVRRNDTE